MHWQKLCLFTIALCSLEEGAAETPKKWQPALYLNGKYGAQRNIAGAILFAPLGQTPTELMYLDLRFLADSKSAKEGSLGIGKRWFSDDQQFIFGFYGFYDLRYTRLGNRFSQVTLGGEIISEIWDYRFNLYWPENKFKTVIQNQGVVESLPRHSYFSGNQEYYVVDRSFKTITVREIPLKGFDLEIGRSLPGIKFLRLHGAYYHFQGRAGAPSIDGVRLRGNFELNQYLSFRLEGSYDNERKASGFIGVALRIPLGSSGSKAATLSALNKLMTEPPERDIDIVIAAGTPLVSYRPAGTSVPFAPKAHEHIAFVRHSLSVRNTNQLGQGGALGTRPGTARGARGSYENPYDLAHYEQSAALASELASGRIARVVVVDVASGQYWSIADFTMPPVPPPPSSPSAPLLSAAPLPGAASVVGLVAAKRPCPLPGEAYLPVLAASPEWLARGRGLATLGSAATDNDADKPASSSARSAADSEGFSPVAHLGGVAPSPAARDEVSSSWSAESPFSHWGSESPFFHEVPVPRGAAAPLDLPEVGTAIAIFPSSPSSTPPSLGKDKRLPSLSETGAPRADSFMGADEGAPLPPASKDPSPGTQLALPPPPHSSDPPCRSISTRPGDTLPPLLIESSGSLPPPSDPAVAADLPSAAAGRVGLTISPPSAPAPLRLAAADSGSDTNGAVSLAPAVATLVDPEGGGTTPSPSPAGTALSSTTLVGHGAPPVVLTSRAPSPSPRAPVGVEISSPLFSADSAVNLHSVRVVNNAAVSSPSPSPLPLTLLLPTESRAGSGAGASSLMLDSPASSTPLSSSAVVAPPASAVLERGAAPVSVWSLGRESLGGGSLASVSIPVVSSISPPALNQAETVSSFADVSFATAPPPPDTPIPSPVTHRASPSAPFLKIESAEPASSFPPPGVTTAGDEPESVTAAANSGGNGTADPEFAGFAGSLSPRVPAGSEAAAGVVLVLTGAAVDTAAPPSVSSRPSTPSTDPSLNDCRARSTNASSIAPSRKVESADSSTPTGPTRAPASSDLSYSSIPPLGSEDESARNDDRAADCATTRSSPAPSEGPAQAAAGVVLALSGAAGGIAAPPSVSSRTSTPSTDPSWKDFRAIDGIPSPSEVCSRSPLVNSGAGEAAAEAVVLRASAHELTPQSSGDDGTVGVCSTSGPESGKGEGPDLSPPPRIPDIPSAPPADILNPPSSLTAPTPAVSLRPARPSARSPFFLEAFSPEAGAIVLRQRSQSVPPVFNPEALAALYSFKDDDLADTPDLTGLGRRLDMTEALLEQQRTNLRMNVWSSTYTVEVLPDNVPSGDRVLRDGSVVRTTGGGPTSIAAMAERRAAVDALSGRGRQRSLSAPPSAPSKGRKFLMAMKAAVKQKFLPKK